MKTLNHFCSINETLVCNYNSDSFLDFGFGVHKNSQNSTIPTKETDYYGQHLLSVIFPLLFYLCALAAQQLLSRIY